MSRLILRKSLRIAATIFPLIYYFSGKRTTLIVVFGFLCFFICVEIFRFRLICFKEDFFSLLKYYVKEKEKKNLLTATWFLLSIFLIVVFFRKDIAITAILFLIFGDTASALFGVRFGRTKIIANRSLEGSLAFFAACLLVAIVLNFTLLVLPWYVYILGALSATLIEIIPLPLDDNFTVGIFSAIIMSVLT
ncbi:MAG: hypothetical protein NC908_02150 [Candidatus Omnitrophica bacterium]|nr:hypothetical protein [Candidatus Omnitrophota bacterium]